MSEPRPNPGPDPDGGPLPPARALLSDAQFNSVMGTVLDSNPDMDPLMAGRIVEEGIKFVAACARFPEPGLAPSRIVDEGWHALILHTALYADLCGRLGRYVHHFPGYDPTNYDPAILDRTRARIVECGYQPDAELWGPPTGDLLVTVAAQCQHSPECSIRPMPKPEWPVSA